MEKVLVLLSGGIDSAVALADALNKYGENNIETLTFNYGQSNVNEIKYSKKISKHYNVKNTVLNISNLFSFGASSLLAKNGKKPSHLSYEAQVDKSGKVETDLNVPFRNGVFLSIATSFALSRNIKKIVYGIHFEPGIVIDLYPDCSEKFNTNMNKAIYYGTGEKIVIEAPFVKILKSDVVKIGIDYKVPFEKTWTCYDSGKQPCGKCNSCKDRLFAFEKNNAKDPAKYMED